MTMNDDDDDSSLTQIFVLR